MRPRSSHMQLLLCALCLLCAAALSPQLSAAHYHAPSVASLTITSVGSGSVRVTLPDRRSSTRAPLAECTFTYSTSAAGLTKNPAAASAAVPAKIAVGRIDVVSVAAALDGSCVSSNSDYWTYELCFGRHFKQYHGADIYMLGRDQARNSHEKGHALMMEGGDMCLALDPVKPRAVKMNFACKVTASTPQIMSISETSTCFYEVTIATDRVCTDDSFPVLTGDAPGGSFGGGGGPGGSGSQLDQGTEDWFVEMSELEGVSGAGEAAEPVVMCQAYSLEYRATSITTLRFSSMELRITKLQGSSASNRQLVSELPADYRSFTARRPGRVDVDPAFLRTGYGALALDDQADYDGALSLVKVYA